MDGTERLDEDEIGLDRKERQEHQELGIALRGWGGGDCWVLGNRAGRGNGRGHTTAERGRRGSAAGAWAGTARLRELVEISRVSLYKVERRRCCPNGTADGKKSHQGTSGAAQDTTRDSCDHNSRPRAPPKRKRPDMKVCTLFSS